MVKSRAIPSRRPRTRAPRIALVADPEPRLRELLRLALQPVGFRVVEADTAGEALRQMRRLRPSVLIADVWLPEPGAYWLLAKLAAARITTGTRIVVTSADCDPELARAAYVLGADYFLPKPFRPTGLITLLVESPSRSGGSNPVIFRLPDRPPAECGRHGKPAAGGAVIVEFPSGRVWSRRGQETAT